ncbi:type I polyketide synthase, partial [Nocardia nova]|uniref:type I polyketide synthase n=1 Tax=Nocardia nova TaxID=37330 RepID=UPI00379C5AA2
MDDQLVGDAGEAIAVVGVSCRFPEVNGPAQYWDLLRAGRSTIAAVPPERAATDGDRPRGSYLADPYAFDADFFGISPLEAASIDPQQRMMLELCWQAMESAGYAAAGERPREVALYLGTTADDFAGAVLRGAVPVNRFTKAGTSRAMIANRVSHALGFTGPSLTVDTGQSSSLVAVHLACAGIRSGECALALAGGVQLNLDPSSDLIMSESGVVSPDGVCYTFDARANGTVRGEGGAVVVLKPLTRALSDGDTVLAVIRGGAVGHDGPGGSLTTPAVAGQEAVIRRACRAAGVHPAAVQYVEAHGTGTPIGDPVEAEALARVYGRAPGRADALLIGSVKPTLGHLEAAAGVAGLVKVVLALGHGVLPASLHYQRPHPRIPMRSWRLQVPTSAREWVSPHGIRLAGVSAFGLGGADAHLIVEQAPRPAAAAGERVALGLSAVLLGGRGGAALRERAGRLADHLSATDDPSPVRLAQATARLARFDERAAVVTDDPAELSAALSALRDGSAHPRLVAGRAVPGRTAFVFAGQGTQRPGMGRELHDAFPAFAAAWDEAMDALTAGLDPAEAAAIRDAVWGTDAAILEQTRFAQRGLFAFEFALCRLLESWGVRADVVLGHSLGEIVAAAIAGAITLTDAARVVGARVRLLGRLRDPGAMAAVSAPEGVTRALLAGHPRGGEVDIAAVNGPEATVIAGAADAVEAVRTDLAARGLRVRRLRVSHAFHSRLMDPVLDEFAAVLADSAPLPPRLEVIANVTGRPAEPGYGSADYWVRHLRRPIRFADGLAAAQAAGVTRFVEIGPDGSLSLQVTASTGGGCTVIPLSARTGGERAALATGVGRLLVAGIEPDWPALLGTVGLRHCPQLPAYPFQHRTFRAGALAPAAVTAPPSVPENDSDPGTAPAAGPWDTDAVSALVCDELANLLGFAAGTVPPDRPFHELGLDSLGALRIHDRLTRETGLRLPASIVFDYPTPRKLARFVSGVQIAATGAPQADEAVAAANDPVVVVGMGCRFPGGVNSPAQLWRLVAEGGDAISEFPADRGWDLQRWYDPEPGVPGKAYTHWGGFLTGAGDFDAEFFNVSPREASGMDPQQRVLLEVAWEALEDAGIDAHTLRGSDTGIFTGVMSHGHDAAPRLTDGYGLTDAAASVVSGRLAYALGSEGPAITVDTACSSSLVALHLACRSIRSGECELALAGGVTVMSTPGMFVEFSRQRGLSVDGRCRSFGVGAEGTGWGEG